MRRRDLIAAAGTVAAASAVASAAHAGGPTAAPAGAVLNIAGVGLPVIVDGRLRNYVFVSVRLHLGAGKTPEFMRTKEPFIRDALVKVAHRTPFSIADDWTRLNESALAASLQAAAAAIAGRGSVTRVEVTSQAPRRRTGVRGAR